MEEFIYNNIGAVLQVNKHGELIAKRMKAAKVCDGLFVTAPDRTQFVNLIIEYNGVKWIEHTIPAGRVNIEHLTKRMPGILASIETGKLAELNDYRKELHRRIFTPDAPAIMELKQPQRKAPTPLADGEKRVNVYMYKGCTDETTDKKVTVKEITPHIYTRVYKLRGYGERVKIIFDINGVYFQGADLGAFVMEREDFAETCAKAYKNVRKNITDGAAKGMAFFVELTKRINAATETPQISTESAQAADILTEGERSEPTQTQQPEPAATGHSWSQLPKFPPQLPQIARAVNHAAPTHTHHQQANKQVNSVVKDYLTTQHINFVTPRKWPAANSPPILVAPPEIFN
ncbi:MAG: hypothetical protein HDT00_00320 [Bacteroidales bacterium]|nr:hypothetical protein [Bacteroidales bacterium]